MSLEEISPGLPIGKSFDLESNKETLPVLNVDNEVTWINQNLDLPFNLKVGEPTNLGLFLNDGSLEEDCVNKKVEVMPEHGRSFIIGRILFADKNINKRNIYRDIVTKGGGCLYPEYERGVQVGSVSKIENNHSESYGILNLSDALHDTKMSELFLKYGIRTAAPVSIIELKQIVNKGEVISVEEAKRRGLIDENSKPVLQIRAFRTSIRLADTNDRHGERDFSSIVERRVSDAMNLIAEEFGFDKSNFKKEDYLKWLAGMVARNVAIMHKHGFVHGFLGFHNITLDGAIVDFDSVEEVDKGSNKFRSDYIKALSTINGFVMNQGYGFTSPFFQSIGGVFEDIYKKTINEA